MTAIPCGQKKSKIEMIHNQIVTPPLAAMDGTTFKLKTATTNSSTRSQRPRTRLRCGELASEDKAHLDVSSRPRRDLLFLQELERPAGPSTPHRPGKPGRSAPLGMTVPKLSVRPRRRCAPAVPWQAPAQHLRKRQCVCRCPARYAARRSSIARPTSRAAP